MSTEPNLLDTPSPTEGVTHEELQLAARNHGMPLEGLGYDITPVGMHYLLIHFDIPQVDATTWSLPVDGHVERPLGLTLEDIRSRPAVSRPVTMECAGNGRARLTPRPRSQPWLNEAVGTAEWTGTPLAPVLQEAGIRDGAVEVVFTGWDHGIQGEVEQDYARALTVAEASRPEVLLAYEINGQPLPPQHGYPVRLLVPGWYGMTSVKWLRRIEVVTETFQGYQHEAYRILASEDDPGIPVTRIYPRALMVPPGFPEFLSDRRYLPAEPVVLRGRAWSGWADIVRVEVSTDAGQTWAQADLGERVGPDAWKPWTFRWEPPGPGEYELCPRATDAAGNVQPLDQQWNVGGMQNNSVQRVHTIVRSTA